MGKKLKREANKSKREGQPTRPQNAYWLWLGANREALTKEVGSGKKLSEVSKLAGERWKALPTAQKLPFEKQADEKRAEYQKALDEWKKTQGECEDGADESEAV